LSRSLPFDNIFGGSMRKWHTVILNTYSQNQFDWHVNLQVKHPSEKYVNTFHTKLLCLHFVPLSFFKFKHILNRFFWQKHLEKFIKFDRQKQSIQKYFLESQNSKKKQWKTVGDSYHLLCQVLFWPFIIAVWSIFLYIHKNSWNGFCYPYFEQFAANKKLVKKSAQKNVVSLIDGNKRWDFGLTILAETQPVVGFKISLLCSTLNRQLYNKYFKSLMSHPKSEHCCLHWSILYETILFGGNERKTLYLLLQPLLLHTVTHRTQTPRLCT
jgi:hypothetical protein